MNNGKYVFSQLVEFLPQRVFDRFVTKYDGNKKVRHFNFWNQLLCMIFCQLSSRDSLTDLIIVIEAHQSKSYHLGFGKNVTLSIFGVYTKFCPVSIKYLKLPRCSKELLRCSKELLG